MHVELVGYRQESSGETTENVLRLETPRLSIQEVGLLLNVQIVAGLGTWVFVWRI